MVIKYSTGYNKDKIKYVGIFHLKDTYKMMFEWLNDKGYAVDETSYKEVIRNNEREVEIRWIVTKEQSDYFQYEFSVFFHGLNVVNTEVEVDGVKKKMQKGELTTEFSWTINKDYKNRFSQNEFSKRVRNYYDKYLVSKRIEEQEILIVRDFEAMLGVLKDYLGVAGTREQFLS